MQAGEELQQIQQFFMALYCLSMSHWVPRMNDPTLHSASISLTYWTLFPVLPCSRDLSRLLL